MLVGSLSGISYARFATALLPVALLSTAATILVLRRAFRRDLAPGRPAVVTPPGRPFHGAMLRKALLVTGLLFAALFAGVDPGVAAMSAAALLLVTRRIRPARVWVHVDWGLLAMFAGLFVVVRGVEVAGWTARGLDLAPESARGSHVALVGVTAVLSNLVSNVPAVLVLRGWPARFADPDAAWLTLAMASTLAGNLTLVGSVANLIVVEQARERARIDFWSYARVGIPLGLITLALGTVWVGLGIGR
jgi:Na+/H+ antiporter NhaD/arsenite permease-like protein